MRYQVPQFIEIEDKIIGPLTIKQFVYLAGGAGMSFIAYRLLPLLLALPVIAVIIVLSLALAFYKVNNRNFIDLMESIFFFYTRDRLYIWKKEPKKIERPSADIAGASSPSSSQIFVPKLSESKLKELAWSLDINENQNPLTGQDGRNTK
jgi:hypothetical protein